MTAPVVLHVDDAPDELRTWADLLNAGGAVRLEVRHPDEVTEKDLADARVVLVDFMLDTWPTRDNLSAPLCMKPPNGLALLSTLQEKAEGAAKDRARAFALYSGRVDAVARGLVPRSHIVARAHNLEWVFEKSGSNEQRAMQVTDLAAAVAALPSPWPGSSAEKAESELCAWLGLDVGKTWREAAWRAVGRCRPPMHDFATHTHGIGILRWMLHRILPYPCFLLDDAHLAARLRVARASLVEQLESSPKLKELFAPARYTGQLSGFLGRRWWRSAVDSVLFELVKDDPADTELLRQKLSGVAPGLQSVAGENVFVVLDADHQFKDTLAPSSEVVEIVPDDWPPFADSAWALKTDLDSSDHLKAMALDDGDA